MSRSVISDRGSVVNMLRGIRARITELEAEEQTKSVRDELGHLRRLDTDLSAELDANDPKMDKLARPGSMGAGAALQKVTTAFGTSPAMAKAAATLRDIDAMLDESREILCDMRTSLEKIERADLRRAAVANFTTPIGAANGSMHSTDVLAKLFNKEG